MAVITDQQRKFYETTLQVTKQEISDLKDQIEEELAKVKDRIAELQNAINASKQMYAAACSRLGVHLLATVQLDLQRLHDVADNLVFHGPNCNDER